MAQRIKNTLRSFWLLTKVYIVRNIYSLPQIRPVQERQLIRWLKKVFLVATWQAQAYFNRSKKIRNLEETNLRETRN